MKHLLALSLLLFALKTSAVNIVYKYITYSIEDGKAILINGTRPSGDITVPNNVTSDGVSYPVTEIKDGAFANNTNLTSIKLPANLTAIGNRAFECCSSLKYVTLQSTSTSIGEYAFSCCTDFQAINLPEGISTIKAGTFMNCSHLKAITIPNSVTVIEERAFKGIGATYFPIGGNVTTIGKEAFAFCVSLQTVNLGSNVKNIASDAFCDCSSLTEYLVDNSNRYFTAVEGVLYSKDKTRIVAYPHSLKNEEYTVPSTVTAIPANVFDGNHYLTSINVDSNNKNFASVGGVLYNKNKTKLQIFPTGKSGAYTVPSTTQTIADSAFYLCDGLTRVTIPNSVTKIGKYCFYGCAYLNYVRIGNEVETIESHTFDNCSQLETLDLGKKVHYIKDNALSALNQNLYIIYCRSTYDYVIVTGCETAFTGDLCTLYVPKGKAKNYQGKDYWKDLGSIKEKDFIEQGDVNQDDQVNISDVTALVNIILGKSTSTAPTIDVNGDGQINISDVTTLVNIILGK